MALPLVRDSSRTDPREVKRVTGCDRTPLENRRGICWQSRGDEDIRFELVVTADRVVGISARPYGVNDALFSVTANVARGRQRGTRLTTAIVTNSATTPSSGVPCRLLILRVEHQLRTTVPHNVSG